MNTVLAPPRQASTAPSVGTAVLLLHGLCSTPEELQSVQNALHGAGHTVCAPRIAGYSFDPKAATQQARPYGEWLATIEAHVDTLRSQHARVALVGISAGSSLALGAAIRCGTKIDAMVLMSTTLVFDGWAIPRTQWLLPLALYTPLGRWWQYRERPPYGVKNERVRAWIERELTQRRISRAGAAVLGISHLREHDRLIRHVRSQLSRVTCPQVLAIHAREDEVASLSNLDVLAHGLGSERLRTLVLENSYHMVSIDNDRQQVARETLAFIAPTVPA
ncbi:MAG: alpha/beta fold hydrolase [Burkholderiaceae bacterium]|nr:alpha/beta fold hydrolase [Burkholderiaceae bacterium]